MGSIVLVILATIAAMASSGPAFAQCPDDPNGLRACGRKLADLRELICFQEVKRGGMLYKDGDKNKNDLESLAKIDDIKWLHDNALPRIGSNDIIFWPHVKRASGIVNECCYNCCTIEQIQEYC